eukprot:403370864
MKATIGLSQQGFLILFSEVNLLQGADPNMDLFSQAKYLDVNFAYMNVYKSYKNSQSIRPNEIQIKSGLSLFQLIDLDNNSLKQWVKILNKFVIRYCWQSEFELVKKIGKGANASVYHVRVIKNIGKDSKREQQGIDYALKMIKKNEIIYQDDRILMIRNEIMTQRLLRGSQLIVELYKVFESDNCIYLLMEYVKGGDLEKLVQSQVTNLLSEKQLKPIMAQLLEGVGHMHDNNIIHRDIKPQNVLVQYSINKEIQIKLADFGLAQQIKENNFLTKKCGTPGYINFIHGSRNVAVWYRLQYEG